MVDESKDVSRFRLDPKDFPTRIDLEVPEEVLAYLQRISDRTGRSISEIAAAIVVQGAETFDPEQFDRYVQILMRPWFSALL
jgi:hypothetical protein